MTAPFAPEAAKLLTGPHTQLVTATAVPGSGDPFPLAVEDYTVSWDEDRAPRVIAELVCPADLSTADLERFDPRTGSQVILTVTYVLPDGTQDTHDVATLTLREREISRPDNVMRLSCASAESLLIDASPSNVQDPDSTATYDNAEECIEIQTSAYTGFTIAGLVITTPRTLDPYTVETYPSDLWQHLTTAADSLDADLYDNGDRVLRLSPRRYVTAASTLALKVGANATMTSSVGRVSREAWANIVKLWYVWVDNAGARHTVFSMVYVDGGPYAANAHPARVHAEDRDGNVTQYIADRTARSILTRLLSRARTYTLEAVSAWWVRPGDTITVQLTTGDQERHLVSSVRYTSGGRMTLTTRLPDNESTIGE